MKRILFIATIILIFGGLTSCDKDNFGYETTVEFTAEGGTKVITGREAIYTLSIGTYDGDEQSAEDVEEEGVETIMAVHSGWLTATAKKFSKEITLTAEPNTTGKRRVLYVY